MSHGTSRSAAYMSLGEVASYGATRIPSAAIHVENYVGVENLLQDSAGRIDSERVPPNIGLTRYLAGDVLIGNIRPYLKKAWLADRDGGASGDVLVVRILDDYRDRLLPEFLFYVLSSDSFFAYDSQFSRGAGMPRGDKSAILRYRIPVPSMGTQRTVVKVLAAFKGLEAELEAELVARRDQLAFYRDYALAFDNSEDVPRIPMGELGVFIRGRRFVKADFVFDGIPSIHYGEIYTHYGTSASLARSSLRRDLAAQLRYAKPGDVVIASVGETVDDVAKAVAWLGETEVAIHDDSFAFRSDVNPTYVAYAMQTADFHAQKSQYVARGKVKRLGREDLGRIAIPVPAPEAQRRIVAILDKFDALANDLSAGLPGELRARRQQYEYYREKLLTFSEATA